MEQKNAESDEDSSWHVYINRHGQVHHFELNDDYSYNPYFGIDIMHFAWTGDHLVIIYHEKHLCLALSLGPSLNPRLMNLQAGWALFNNNLYYHEHQCQDLALPLSLPGLEPCLPQPRTLAGQKPLVKGPATGLVHELEQYLVENGLSPLVTGLLTGSWLWRWIKPWTGLTPITVRPIKTTPTSTTRSGCPFITGCRSTLPAVMNSGSPGAGQRDP